MTDDLIRQAREMTRDLNAERWHADGDAVISLDRITTLICNTEGTTKAEAERLARFIAWCREGVPALIAELEKHNG